MKQTVNMILVLFLLSVSPLSLWAQKTLSDMPNLVRYAKENAVLMEKKELGVRTVLMGNSITEHWAKMRPEFFEKNNLVGRGISGQTSPQMLLRFWPDVIELHPQIVVINAGTNDIAENTGAYNSLFTLNNIKSMASIADKQGIKVILTSVLPVGKYPWRPQILDVPAKIDSLNAEIHLFAEQNKYIYLDYNKLMRDDNGAMRPNLASDGVHPNIEGYKIMEAALVGVLDKVKRTLKSKK